MEHMKYMGNSEEVLSIKSCLANQIEKKTFKIKIGPLKESLKNELNISLDKVDIVVINVMSESLIYYMDKWTGWYDGSSDRYKMGEMPFKNLYDDFKEYLKQKALNILEASDRHILKATPRTKDVGVQCREYNLIPSSSRSTWPSSYFNLVLSGPMFSLNDINFSDSKGDLYVSYIPRPLPPKESLCRERNIFNYPHLEVILKLPKLIIRRYNCHIQQRSLSLNGNIEKPKVEYIHKIKKNTANNRIRVYEYEYVEKYFEAVMHTYSKIPNIGYDYLNEFKQLFDEILNDMKNVNINNASLATGVQVCYNIGGSTYKRIIKHDTTCTSSNYPVLYEKEAIVPMVEFEVSIFDEQAVDAGAAKAASFVYLNQMLEAVAKPDRLFLAKARESTHAALEISCRFCSQIFVNNNAKAGFASDKFKAHIRQSHCREENMTCVNCDETVQFSDLLKNRWCHNEQCAKTNAAHG